MNSILEIFSAYRAIGQAFYHIWWIVLPVAFYFVFKILWMDFVNGNWAKSLSWTLLEVIPPKDLERGPRLMEAVYQGMSGVFVGFNAVDEFLKGMFTDRFSVELVSLEGKIHFYIRTQTKYRNLIEAQVYAQYPDAEIFEVPDYVNNFPKVIPNKDWDLWGADLELIKPDPFPIKTYDQFEEDATGELIDPMASFVELFGTVPPGQNLFYQIVISPLGEDWRVKEMKHVQKLAGRINGDEWSIWSDLAAVFKNLIPALFGPVEFSAAEKKEQAPLEFRLTPGEKEQLKNLEENLRKNNYRVKMRFLCLGKKEGFDKAYVSAFFGAMRQFNDLHSNGLKPENWSKTYAYYVAIDKRLKMRKRKIYRRYKERNMDGKKFAMSTTEMATIFHFPDMSVKTPALIKVESKRGSAPANLPVG
jgi:hypothetical protein